MFNSRLRLLSIVECQVAYALEQLWQRVEWIHAKY